MENLPKTQSSKVEIGTNVTQPKKTADFVYQAATVVAALLLLLTATV